MQEKKFDENDYRNALIVGGVASDVAADVARKTAAARGGKRKDTSREPDLFTDSAEVLASVATNSITTVSVEQKRSRGKKDALIVSASAQIASEPPSGNDMAFQHALMCQVGLPRSKVDGLSFERQSGAASMLIEAGKIWDGTQFVQQSVPYGTLPRLMLAWINTTAVRNKDPHVPVGDSISDFLRLLGKSTSGGRNGGFTAFKKQALALSACRMTLGMNAGGRAYTYNGQPIEQFEAWLGTNPDQPTLWPGTLTLSDRYLRTLLEHAVPLDFRALAALKGSALAMDIYTALADRLHRISGRPVLLHWTNWRQQFGQEYKGKEADKDFKKKFLPALRDVLAVYPQARVKQVDGGILLMPSPPPIPYKS